MILSSADILRILGGNEIIRLSAKLSITDGRPSLSGREGIYIYVERFPSVQEFEATWSIYIESDEEVDLVVAEIKRLLPKVRIEEGLLTVVKTTDFRSESTQTAPEAPKAKTAQVDLTQYEERFQSLVEDVQDQMLLVSSGRPGRDGQDGRDGADGRDGKDLVATDAELFDLKDAGQSILPMEKGQVLTWDGGKWTNLFVRQTMSAGGSAVGTGGDTGGNTGVSSTIGWTYHPHDHTQEPNSGHFHTDSSDGELVTVFHVSNETSRGNSVEVLLRDLLVQGYDRIYVALGEDLSQAHLYSITGYTETAGGFEINVTHVETAGLEPDYQNAKLYEFLFTKSAATGGSGSLTVQERAGTEGDPQNSAYGISKLSFNTNNGFSVTNMGNGEALVNLGSAFAPWLVDGQETLDPEGEEPVEFVAGAGIEITTNPNTYPQQIIITSTGGGGGGGQCDGILDGGNADDGSSHGVDCPTPGIEEAPEDGQQYARQDGAWEVVVTGGGDVEEAPIDGNFYVRHNGAWIDLRSALSSLGVTVDEAADGGDFTTGQSTATDSRILDAGNFTTGESVAIDSETMDGGDFSGA